MMSFCITPVFHQPVPAWLFPLLSSEYSSSPPHHHHPFPCQLREVSFLSDALFFYLILCGVCPLSTCVSAHSVWASSHPGRVNMSARTVHRQGNPPDQDLRAHWHQTEEITEKQHQKKQELVLKVLKIRRDHLVKPFWWPSVLNCAFYTVFK